MKTPVLLLSLSLVIFDLSSAGKENKRQTRPLDDVSYETIFSLCEGTFNIPVLARTRTQKSACIRFWRNKKYFSVRKINGKKVLCFRGKEVLKMSEFIKVIESEFLHCKGVGSRKLKQWLATRYEGVSEPRVQKILSKAVSTKWSMPSLVTKRSAALFVQVAFRYVSILPLSYHGISNESPCISSSTFTWPRNKTLSF